MFEQVPFQLANQRNLFDISKKDDIAHM